MNVQPKQFNKRTMLGVVGCFGGLLIHLIIGSLYAWGIINIYITSYYRLSDHSVTLQNNAIAFPAMMFSIGITMKFGLTLAELTHPLIVLASTVTMQSILTFLSSYIQNMSGFILVYGVIFGLFSGINFMIPIVECNKYFPGRRMYVNGVVLTGAGLGSLIFGLFSYNFLNPNQISPIEGYYIGNHEVESIAIKVPEYLRWLSLLYLLIGLTGSTMISYVCIQNRNKQNKIKENQKQIILSSPNYIQNTNANQPQDKMVSQNDSIKQQNISAVIFNQKSDYVLQKTEAKLHNNKQNVKQVVIKQTQIVPIAKYPTDIKEAFCAKVFWLKVAIIFFGSCGIFMMNGNYKTYVKNSINDDQFLTIIGVVGSVGNGFSRFFWNLLFLHTGYRFVIVLNLGIQIIVYICLRFAIDSSGAYLLLIFMSNCCIGGFLVMTPTFLQMVFGEKIGSNIYGFFWEAFSLSNLLQYVYVSSLSQLITFDNVIYICLGMSLFSLVLVITGNFEAPWKNPQDLLGYCKYCNKSQVQ